MKLSEIDWNTITRREARALIPAATRAEHFAAQKWDAGEISKEEWDAALFLEENFRVYALCGEKPNVINI